MGNSTSALKQQALLFDKLYSLYPINDTQLDRPFFSPHVQADIDFLESRGFLENITAERVVEFQQPHDNADEAEEAARICAYIESQGLSVEDVLHPLRTILRSKDRVALSPAHHISHQLLNDLFIRRMSADLNAALKLDTVPICRAELQTSALDRSGISKHPNLKYSEHDVLQVALEGLPSPNEDCSWEDILDFKADLHDKQWGFRRWLHSLATKQLSEAEIQEELEWSLNEYTKAMNIHDLKASHSFVDVFVISPLEILENIAKFNWSKLAKGTLSVRQRKIDLMEAEMKAPGKECAYVYDARKRFGGE